MMGLTLPYGFWRRGAGHLKLKAREARRIIVVVFFLPEGGLSSTRSFTAGTENFAAELPTVRYVRYRL